MIQNILSENYRKNKYSLFEKSCNLSFSNHCVHIRCNIVFVIEVYLIWENENRVHDTSFYGWIDVFTHIYPWERQQVYPMLFRWNYCFLFSFVSSFLIFRNVFSFTDAFSQKDINLANKINHIYICSCEDKKLYSFRTI